MYSLCDDAHLLIHAITKVWQLDRYTMLTHDRGTSVGMIALSMFATQDQRNAPAEVMLTNANIYLPLANLTAFQTALLNPATARNTARDDAGNACRGHGSSHVHAATHAH